MNRKQLGREVRSLVAAYIKQYQKTHSDDPDEEVLKDLRSWSSLKNGTRVYINASDLMPELTLSDDAYVHIEALGFTAVLRGEEVDSMTITLTHDSEYGLPDVHALVEYLTLHMADEKLDVTVADFFKENLVAAHDGGITAVEVQQNATNKAKADLLDQLFTRSDIAFRA